MPVVSPTNAPTFDVGNAIVTGLASPSRGASDTAAWRIRFNSDAPSPKHSLDREEIFVILDGGVTATFADREETAEAGGALIVPANEEFSLAAKGGQAEAVCVLPVGGKALSDGASFTPPWAE